MGARFKNSETELLTRSDVALENVVAQPAIAAAMAEMGYDSALIEEGKGLNQAAHEAFKFNKTEDDETTVASTAFKEAKEAVEIVYRLHRKKAKVVYRNDPDAQIKLLIHKALPVAYASRLAGIERFYDVLAADEALLAKMARLKLTLDDVTQAKQLIADLKSKRTTYLREVGESESATKAKDEALAKLDDWMSEFYAVARIALEDDPQLLEALGKAVKS